MDWIFSMLNFGTFYWSMIIFYLLIMLVHKFSCLVDQGVEQTQTISKPSEYKK